jgi:hypothetical protein
MALESATFELDPKEAHKPASAAKDGVEHTRHLR